MKEYKATAEKIVFHLQRRDGTEDYLFGKDEVKIFADDSTLWFEFEGKRYKTIDSPAMYIKADFIEKVGGCKLDVKVCSDCNDLTYNGSKQ